MNMVERVARAIANGQFYSNDRELYEGMARAALMEMRIATDTMINAGCDVEDTGEGPVVGYIQDVWDVMINAALYAH